MEKNPKTPRGVCAPVPSCTSLHLKEPNLQSPDGATPMTSMQEIQVGTPDNPAIEEKIVAPNLKTGGHMLICIFKKSK